MSTIPSFGDQLTHLFEEKDISQAEFARRVGKSSGVVQFIRAGKRTPPIQALPRWADVLGLRGEDRELFILAGWLAHSPPFLVDYVSRLRRRTRSIKGAAISA